MIGEIFAYYYGKSKGRAEERRQRPRKPMSHDELAQRELVVAIVFGCIIAAVIYAVFGL